METHSPQFVTWSAGHQWPSISPSASCPSADILPHKPRPFSVRLSHCRRAELIASAVAVASIQIYFGRHERGASAPSWGGGSGKGALSPVWESATSGLCRRFFWNFTCKYVHYFSFHISSVQAFLNQYFNGSWAMFPLPLPCIIPVGGARSTSLSSCCFSLPLVL